MNRYLAILAFSAALAIGCFLPGAVRAGCCAVMSPGKTTFENLTHDQCEEKNAAYAGDSFQFEEDKVVSGAGCVSKTESVGGIDLPRVSIAPQLEVSLPGFKGFSPVVCDEQHPDCSTPWLAEYIKSLYNYALVVITLMAAISLMVGGVIRMTAGGNRAQITSSMEFIKGGILGMILAFASYTILFLLNPNLTVLPTIKTGYIAREDLPEGISEEENGSESEANDSVAPQGCPDPSKIIPITTQSTGASSITASEKLWLPESVEQFKKVVKIAKEKYGISIRIASALRSVNHQTQLFNAAVKKYGSEAAARKWVAKPSCNSPHVRGVAVDAWAVPQTSDNQAKLQKAFQEAGWKRYCAESWHFQVPGATPNVPCSP